MFNFICVCILMLFVVLLPAMIAYTRQCQYLPVVLCLSGATVLVYLVWVTGLIYGAQPSTLGAILLYTILLWIVTVIATISLLILPNRSKQS